MKRRLAIIIAVDSPEGFPVALDIIQSEINRGKTEGHAKGEWGYWKFMFTTPNEKKSGQWDLQSTVERERRRNHETD